MERFIESCRRWGNVTNLVAAGDRDRLWERHVEDSLQLLPLAERAGPRWIDLGSGGGFPGLVVAIAREGTQMTLVEANGKKAAFLADAAGNAGVPVLIEPHRIETLRAVAMDVVSARALAPLPDLLGLAGKFFGAGTLGLFPKGRDAADEVTAARLRHAFALAVTPSATGPGAAILSVTALGAVR